MSVTQLTTWANKKPGLYNTGDGGVQYPPFEAFLVEDIMQHIGFYINNSLSHSLQVSYKFDSPDKNEINGSAIVNIVIEKIPTKGTGNSRCSSHVEIKKYLVLQENSNQIGIDPHSYVTLFMCCRVQFILVSN